MKGPSKINKKIPLIKSLFLIKNRKQNFLNHIAVNKYESSLGQFGKKKYRATVEKKGQ